MRLPNGVAVVRAETPWGKVVLVSDRLTDEEAEAARILAADRVMAGLPFVLLKVTDVVRRMDAA